MIVFKNDVETGRECPLCENHSVFSEKKKVSLFESIHIDKCHYDPCNYVMFVNKNLIFK